MSQSSPVPACGRLLVLCISSLPVVAACSGSGTSPPAPPECAQEECEEDAGQQGELPEQDAGWDPWDVLGDAGNPSGGPLHAALRVSGANRVCGDCAVITADVGGGQTPYDYAWNVPGLTGPGPHEVCDAQARTYELTVTDSTADVVGAELAENMQQKASVNLECSPATVDAGAGLSGCKLLFDASLLSVLNPNGPYVERAFSCPTLDGGPGLSAAELMTVKGPDGGPPEVAAQYLTVPEGLRAGTGYEFVFELLFPLSIGGNITMELWGTREGCSVDEKIGAFKVEGVSKQSVCLTPQQDFDKIMVKPGEDLELPLFNVSFGVSMTLCSGCGA